MVHCGECGRYPYDETVTASFVYLRLHGRTELYASNYSDEELKAMRDKIHDWVATRMSISTMTLGLGRAQRHDL